jgi:hypothetical protein
MILIATVLLDDLRLYDDGGATVVALRTTKISASDPPSTWWPWGTVEKEQGR